MLYSSYQTFLDLSAPWRRAAALSSAWFDGPARLPREAHGFRRLSAALDLIARSGTTHTRPSYRIPSVTIGNREVAVREDAVLTLPFGTLLHFAKEQAEPQPKMLLVAPMSGHFATLLRGTVRTLLRDHDVYITDWHNARDVPVSAGQFDFEDFVAYLMHFLEHIGPGGHVLAVCQPAVPVLAAAALMAQANNPAQPRSMTLMAGPIDTRYNPSKVNLLAKTQPIEWFERKMISRVPLGQKGAGRAVYPGFVQLAAFMSMNLERHIAAHERYYRDVVEGNAARAAAHREFYDEYFAVMDLPAEFYLQTVKSVFQDHDLPQGRMRWRGVKIEPKAIRRTALLTVEGELDDICTSGQTMAALDLCVGLRPAMRRHHLQTGAGHYGVFNGRRWTSEIYPRVRALVQGNSR